MPPTTNAGNPLIYQRGNFGSRFFVSRSALISTANILATTGSKETRSARQICEIPFGGQFKLRGYFSNVIFFPVSATRRNAALVASFSLSLSLSLFFCVAGRRRRFVKKMFRRVMHICPGLHARGKLNRRAWRRAERKGTDRINYRRGIFLQGARALAQSVLTWLLRGARGRGLDKSRENGRVPENTRFSIM